MTLRCFALSFLTLATMVAAPAPAGTTWTQKRFFVTFWCPPPATDEALARVAAEGFNLTWAPEAGLDVAARHGLRVMLMSDLLVPQTLDDSAKRAQLDALIGRVKGHPALECYHLTDEPGAGAFPAWGKLVAYLRERDPAHFAYINLFPTYANEQQLGVSVNAADRARAGYPTNFAGVGTDDQTVLRYREHLKRYVETVKPELISYDHYHFLKPDANGKPVDGGQYFLNLGLIRLAALEARVPFLNIIQANTIEKSWRLPNAEELRFLVYTTMAYGGRGISYFTYWGPASYNGLYQDGKPAPLLQPVIGLNKELGVLGPELMKMESTGVYHTAPVPYGGEAISAGSPVQVVGSGNFVLGLFGQGAQTSGFMVVNRDYTRPSQATLRIGIPGSRIQEFDRQKGIWSAGPVLSKERMLEVPLQPGDGRLFLVDNSVRRLASPRDALK